MYQGCMYVGWGGADEQGGLGGGTPPMKRGHGGGSPKLDVKFMFTIERVL